MTEPNDPPIFVNSSPATVQTGTAVRDAILVLSVLPMLVAVIGKRDLVGLINFIGSSEFAPAAGVIISGAVVIWRQVIARQLVKQTVTVAEARPENVIVANVPLIAGIAGAVTGLFRKRG